MSVTTEEAIFNAEQYDLNIPKIDGHKADKLVVSFGGQLELDRTSEDDLALIESLLLGRDISLSITATVVGKGFAYTARDDGETAGYQVRLKVHSLEGTS